MKVPKKYSKKSKRTIKKYADGGDTETDQMDPSVNKNLPQSPSGNTPSVQTSSAAESISTPQSPSIQNTKTPFTQPNGIGGAALSVGQIGSDVIDKNVNVNQTTGEGAIGKEIGKDALSRAGQGAAIGSVFGPVGTLIGAGVGAIGGGIEGAIQGKKKKKAIQDQTASNLQSENAAGSGHAYGFKKGGKIIKNGTQNKKPFKAIGGAIGSDIDTEHPHKKKKHSPNHAKGGVITEGTTGTADDVDVNVKNGDFIAISKKKKEAAKLVKETTGKADGVAPKDGGDVPIKISKGETIIPKETVEAIKGNGDEDKLKALAPNAKEKKYSIKKKGKQDGGDVSDENSNDEYLDEEGNVTSNTNEEDANTDSQDEAALDEEAQGMKNGGYAEGDVVIEPSSFEQEQNKTIEEMVKKKPKEEPHVVGGVSNLGKVQDMANPIVKTPTPQEKIFDALGGVAGIASLGQTGLGLAQLYGRKRPVGTVDPQLLKQQQEALKESTTGLSPAENALARTDIENTRRADVRNIVGQSGGNSGAALANIGAAGTRAQRGLLDLGVRNERLKMSKQQRADQLTGVVAREKRQLVNDELNAFNQNQVASSNLTQAGLSNFFGNLQYNKAAKAQSEREAKYGVQTPTYTT